MVFWWNKANLYFIIKELFQSHSIFSINSVVRKQTLIHRHNWDQKTLDFSHVCILVCLKKQKILFTWEVVFTCSSQFLESTLLFLCLLVTPGSKLVLLPILTVKPNDMKGP